MPKDARPEPGRRRASRRDRLLCRNHTRHDRKRGRLQTAMSALMYARMLTPSWCQLTSSVRETSILMGLRMPMAAAQRRVCCPLFQAIKGPPESGEFKLAATADSLPLHGRPAPTTEG